MVKVKENCLEWALKHLVNFYTSDFYPKQFEVKAIQHNWAKVKDYVLSLDLNSYTPKTPIITLAPKPNGTFRVVHQLDVIDALIYSSLVYEVSSLIEDFRIPKTERIACSYRIKPDLGGSFFDKNDNGWEDFTSNTEELIKKYNGGYVLVCDIADFYNQIYIHQIRNLIAEAGKGKFDEQAEILEDFLLKMNDKNSQGIPVGPAPSILLAEIIMADIDRQILRYSRDFVRWVDDIRIFFKKREQALTVLHELTRFLYSAHRLIFAGEKTSIRTIEEFEKRYFKNEEKEEREAILKSTEEIAIVRMEELLEDVSPYDDIESERAYQEIFEEVAKEKQFKILSDVYFDFLKRTLDSDPDAALIRHVLRKAGRYKIRSILPLVLENFERLIPFLREVVIYLNKTLTPKFVKDHEGQINEIFKNFFISLPYINTWLAYLLQNDCFNEIDFPKDYAGLSTIRGQALVAYRRNDITWVKSHKDSLDTMNAWDKRAILFSSLLLSIEEMKVWLRTVAARGDIIDQSVVSYLISRKGAS